jgi:hypothetical protein
MTLPGGRARSIPVISLALGLIAIGALVAGLASSGMLGRHKGGGPGPVIRPLYFDGRAKRMIALSQTTQESRGTAKLWACLCFTADNIRLAPDGRFGKVYAVTVGQGSKNPFWSGTPLTAVGEMSTSRPVRLGHWDWYANSYKVLPGWQVTDWAAVTQMNYATITSPPLEINFDRYGVGIERSVGYVARVSGKPEIHDVRSFFPVSSVIGKWVDFVIGVRWATDSTGAIRVLTRCRQCGDKHWVLRYARKHIVTMQWGAGVMNRDGTSTSSGREMKTLDKQGLYYGFYRQPSSFPTDRILEMGLVRAGDEAAAKAAVG